MRGVKASAADEELVEHARRHDVTVSIAQLERWRADGLLPPNKRRALGRGKGSTSVAPDEAKSLVVFLGRQARQGRRRHDLALLALDAGLPISADAVRAAFGAPIVRLRIRAEALYPEAYRHGRML